MGGFYTRARFLELLQSAVEELHRAGFDSESDAVEQAIVLLRDRLPEGEGPSSSPITPQNSVPAAGEALARQSGAPEVDPSGVRQFIYALVGDKLRGVISEEQATSMEKECRVFPCGHCSAVHADIKVYHNVIGRHLHIHDDAAAYEAIRRVEAGQQL